MVENPKLYLYLKPPNSQPLRKITCFNLAPIYMYMFITGDVNQEYHPQTSFVSSW